MLGIRARRKLQASRRYGAEIPMKNELLASRVAQLRTLAPYAALELIMPGGSVLALLLWLYRRKAGARN